MFSWGRKRRANANAVQETALSEILRAWSVDNTDVAPTKAGFDWLPGSHMVRVRISEDERETKTPRYRITITTDFIRSVPVHDPAFVRKAGGFAQSLCPTFSPVFPPSEVVKKYFDGQPTDMQLFGSAYVDETTAPWLVGFLARMSIIQPSFAERVSEPMRDEFGVGMPAFAAAARIDLGTGTGAVAERAALGVGPKGKVVGVDISTDMLALARRRLVDHGLDSFELLEGRAESIPVANNAFDIVLACLSMMYVIDREAAAREIARVLRPGGRFIAAVWAGPEQSDIVLFQQTAGKFAGTPPVPGVGPGALADPGPFLAQLEGAGLHAEVEAQALGFEFLDFGSAWDALAGVTTAQLPEDRRQEAKNAVKAAMYPDGDGPRRFRNRAQFIVARRSR